MSKKYSLSNAIAEMKGNLIADVVSDTRFIPDVITFVNDPRYLDLLSQGISLRKAQEIILKAFYCGSEGNESLLLDEEDIKWCKDNGLDSEDRGSFLESVNKGGIFNELVLVWGRRCLSEDTYITDPDTGYRWTLGDLWDSGVKTISSWTYDEDNRKMKKIVNCPILYQGKRPVYRVETNSGHYIEATDNHVFLTQDGWKQLKDITTNDKLALALSEPFFGKSSAISEDEAAILGYMTGDGCCSQSCNFFTCSNKELLEDFKSRLNRISGNIKIFNDPWTGARSKEYQYRITAESKQYEKYFNEKMGFLTSRPKKNDLRLLLDKHGIGGKTCHKKRVPDALWDCPKNVIASYLKALFSCDGNINSRKNSNLTTFEFTTVNKDQAYDIQSLLLRFGIVACIRKRKQRTRVKIENRSYHNISYNLNFSRSQFIKTFIEEIGLTGKTNQIIRAKNNIEKVDCSRAIQSEDDCITFSTVRYISEIGEKRTFDLQVSNKKSLQNFTAQGVICHNSGKDFLCSVVALYEAMKLLEAPHGNPYKMYEVSTALPITILTIANTQDQAQIAFAEIKDKLLRSPYFENKHMKEGIETNSIYLLTPKDKEENKKLKKKGLPLKKGSILIQVGNSNSTGQLGKGVMVLILDEVASYRTTGGSSSGDRIYSALTPSIMTYYRDIPILDEHGNEMFDEKGEKIVDRINDGKILSISSPRAKEGKFYELFEQAKTLKNKLACRLSTWQANPRLTEAILRRDNQGMSDEDFTMEYGAEFSGIAGESFFERDNVEACFKNHGRMLKEVGQPGIVYFVHVDPATNSHNYSLVIAHREMLLNQQTKQSDMYVIVDHIRVWSPGQDQPIDIEEIDKYVINLKKRFHLGLVTYDRGFSMASIIKLRKNGIPAKETHFGRPYKVQIYTLLENLVNSGRILIPHHGLLREEMLSLLRKYDMGRGFKVYPPRDGDGCKTDDVVDSLAGAAFSAMSSHMNRLPQGRMVNFPLVQSDQNNMVWRGMQGVIGVGPGQQVARRIEERNPLPFYRR